MSLPEFSSLPALAWLKVVRVDGAYFWADLVPDNACATGGCGASGTGCQTNAFARLLTKQPLLKFPLPAHINLQINDQVLMSLPEETLFQMTWWVYGASMLALIAGVALGVWLSGDGLGLLLGIVFLSGTWMILNRYFSRHQPQIIEVKPITENR